MLNKKPHETTVLITGASNGIGLASSYRLAELGFQVIASARNPVKSLHLNKLAEEFSNVKLIKLDVTDDEKSIQSLINQVEPIDILINNAGIGLVGVAESFSIEQIQHVFNTNVLGVVKTTNAVLSRMRQQNAGMILTLSSIVGPLPDLNQCFYSGSKAMIEHYTAALRNDLEKAGYNITVANIHPGPVVTSFEQSTPTGERFTEENNPYPHMQSTVENWRSLMKFGHSVEETVETILTVINTANPPFWNPTEPRVLKNFNDVYHDPSGNRFCQGPMFHKNKIVQQLLPEDSAI